MEIEENRDDIMTDVASMLAQAADVDTSTVTFNDYNYRCDANDAAAQTTWARGEHRVRLCLHHTTTNEASLIGEGWGMIDDTRDSLLVSTASTVDS